MLSDQAYQESPGNSDKVIRLDPGRIERAAGVLARAFQDDPLMIYYLEDPDRRARLLPGFMHTALRYTMRYGEVWAASNLEGVACWLPPGETAVRNWGMIRAAIGVLSIFLGWRAILPMVRIEPRLDRLHHALLPGSHWYLLMLGVDSSRQGRGVGNRLLRWKLSQIQSSGLPCYLETMTERNVPFYQKCGFQVASEIDLDAGKLHVWAMVNKPD